MRRRLAAALVLAAAVGYLARCEAQRRLVRLRDRRRTRRPRGRLLRPDEPHQAAAEYPWPRGCWCGQADNPVHQGTGAAR